MEDLTAAQTSLNDAVEEIYKKVDETEAELKKLSPDTYADKYIASRTGELRAVLRGEIQSIADQIGQQLAEVLPKYRIENRLRQASLTGSDDKGVEAIARNQKLIELELLEEDQFDAEIADALKKQDLATLHLITLAVKQRKYKDGRKASILKSEISEMLLPETKILEEMDEKIRDLESAAKAARHGTPDKRREMNQAVNRYREKQAQKGAE